MSQTKRIKRDRPPVSARVAGTRRLMDGVFHLDRLLRGGTCRSLQDLAGEVDKGARALEQAR